MSAGTCACEYSRQGWCPFVVTCALKRPSQAYYWYTKKGIDVGCIRAKAEQTQAKAKKMKEVYVTIKILLAGLQIISTVGFNLGVDFPPMVTSNGPGQITYQQADSMCFTNKLQTT